ncbi:MAG: helix-hairpin-helix domain-containing protein [Candidatus Gottesmanbacteria bacterium]
MTNVQLAVLFRNIASVYQIKGENRFRIIAYERAADSIEHLTSEAKDYWDDGKVNEIPGVGPTIASHLDELFKTGHAKHFDKTLAQVPKSIFPLLLVPGIGPKRAYKLVNELKLKNENTVVKDLLAKATRHTIAPIEGFGEKSEEEIIKNINTYLQGGIKENRITLREADEIAESVKAFLLENSHISKVDVLGSLRRRVATIGDVDMAIITDDTGKAIDHFCAYRHEKIVERGPTGASLLLTNGRQVDLRVQEADSYGAMLQYFTGSKNHNIKLRTYALSKHLSLSEYGIKDGKTNVVKKFKTEETFYEYIGLQWIPPELREDRGEIDAALRQAQGKLPGLPNLVNLTDIKGDLHIHTDYNLEPSHDIGGSGLVELLDKAFLLGYDYIGISDHNPSVGNHSKKQIIDIMKRRKSYYEQQYSSWKKKNNNSVQLYIMLEIDITPSGELALPYEAFEYIDAAIISVHSSLQQTRDEMTNRLIQAISVHPKVKIIGHPTGRLLGRREGFEINWKELFPLLANRGIALEINAHPYRLDLPDALVYEAIKQHVPLIINSDTHEVSDMDNMSYGVSVARRGWAQKDDILNTFQYNKFNDWLKKS